MDVELQTINELFEEAKPALLALPPDALLRPRISRERALYLTKSLRKEVAPVLSLLPAELSAERAAQRRADYEQLEPRAHVFYAADVAIEDPWSTEKKTRRKDLVRKVREHDRHLSSWAIPVFRRNDQARAAIASILRGRGLRDDADDTIRLVALFRSHWPEVGHKVPIKPAELMEAESDASELIQILDALDSDEPGSPRDLRKRAFTVWFRSYNEVFNAARFLLRDDPASSQRLLAISAERAGAAGDSEDEDDEDEDADAEPKTDREPPR